MKRGLVLEGGALRGMFTCGVIDVLMERGIGVDGIVGVSAGACFGVNMKSGQAGRGVRYNKRFARDKRYSSLHSLLTTGDLFNARFCYHVVPTQYDKFDFDAFERNPMAYYVVATDVVTGQAVYHAIGRPGDDRHATLEWIRASSSMPLVSRVVHIDGLSLLDGGLTDSVPLEFMQREGYERNLVVLTQPQGYVKKPMGMLPLFRFKYRHYPRLVDAMAARHVMYNRQLTLVAEQERAGRCLVLRPEHKLEINHTCHNPQVMQRVYDHGREVATRHLAAIERYLGQTASQA